MRFIGLILKKVVTVRDTKTTDFTRVTCQEVRLVCSEALKQCFEGSISPEIASESNFDLEFF